MKQLELSQLVENYVSSLEKSGLTEQLKLHGELKNFVCSGIKIDSKSDLMVKLSKSKPSLYFQICKWSEDFLQSHQQALMQKQSFLPKKPQSANTKEEETATTTTDVIENGFN